MTDRAPTSLATAAQAAADAAEAIPRGEPWQDAATAAEEAVDAWKADAVWQVFPSTTTPMGADVLADYRVFAEHVSAVGADRAYAQLHADSVDTHPQLASLLRSRVARRDLERLGEQVARSYQRDRDEVVAEYVASFRQTVTQQLADRDAHPSAQVLLDAYAAADRVAAIRAGHEQHERDEAERIARQKREAAEQAHRERVEPLLEFFEQWANVAFVPGTVAEPALKGGTIARWLKTDPTEEAIRRAEGYRDRVQRAPDGRLIDASTGAVAS